MTAGQTHQNNPETCRRRREESLGRSRWVQSLGAVVGYSLTF